MNWIRIPIIIIVALLLLVPSPVLADTSEDVTVTATGYICEAPGGLTLTYISDYEVGLSWTKGADAENTMIRAAVGRLPESRTDGYLVYYGGGTITSDWIENLQTLDSNIHYRAWSQRADEVWEEVGVSDFMEGGAAMLLIALIVFGGIFLTLAFTFKQMTLAWLSGLVFLGLSVIGWTKTTELYDIHWLIGLLGIVATLVVFVLGFLIQHRAAEESFRSQQRYDRDFPPEQELTEEEAYSQLLDSEIGESSGRAARRRARNLRNRYG